MKYSYSISAGATAALFGLLSTSVRAQNDTTEIDGPVIDVLYITDQSLLGTTLQDYQLAGEVLEANPSTTVLAIECLGDGIDTDVCGADAATLTFGSTTWLASDSTGNVELTVDCSIARNTESAVCEEAIKAPAQVFTDPYINPAEITSLITASVDDISSTTFTATLGSTLLTYLPITITAGDELLASASAQATAEGNNAAARSSVMLNGLVAGVMGVMILLL
ncbi:uncharacterized protein Z518_02276 [Rhinocladiella mackenziei CBS 650.93]|uniref:GPI anchored protein n=1 Tax=Rhinocladiella mackenziei CBS 650.93 TaxID=1442369 RepID=A0A0D2HB04_9EURO|nr:uncharacterized protein Z518_02276 [Rhinocladiella mackenziei CBS 650.93]KIX07623.1 hypothetical protein Z518_02276 [Rhinocladiella mackenziei CBS 650.93]